MDPYTVLGVSKNASQDEIKKAYKKLVRQYHPDMNPNNKEVEEKFKSVCLAYTQINDSIKKQNDIAINENNDQKQKKENVYVSEEELITFLEEYERKMEQYGVDFSSYKEQILSLKGKLTKDNVRILKTKLEDKLLVYKQNAQAFDFFQKKYKKYLAEATIIYSCNLVGFDEYIHLRSRIKYKMSTYINLEGNIQKILDIEKQKRNNLFEQLNKELQRRNIDTNEYLKIRNKRFYCRVENGKACLSTNDIKNMLISLQIMNDFETLLSNYQVTLEEYLEKQGKSVMTVTYHDLCKLYNEFPNNEETEYIESLPRKT